jgi:predicted MFS family arabinose efflux permease
MSQALVPDSQRGRVESAMIAVISLGTMGALVMGGILGDVVGPKTVFIVAGLIVLGAGIASIVWLRDVEQVLSNGSNGQHPPHLE